MKNLRQVLKEKVVIFDGAMGTSLQSQNLEAHHFGGEKLEGCNENLVISYPQGVQKVHKDFLEVGVDAIETNTFGATPLVLSEYGLSDKTGEINYLAAQIARKQADQFSTEDHPRFVIGSIGPGTRSPSLGDITFDELYDGYLCQVQGLLKGGVDALLVETTYDTLQAKAALVACSDGIKNVNNDTVLMCQVTIENNGKMLLGTDISAALCTLSALDIDVIGLNCATGPKEMTEHVRYLCDHFDGLVSVLPNAGLPTIIDGHTHYDLTPQELATYLADFSSRLGVNIVGGCCGTTPDHLREVVNTIGIQAPKPRLVEKLYGVSSLYSFTPYNQENAYFSIGERTNVNGSKAFREALLADDQDECISIAQKQITDGAHVLDVCVDYVGRNGVDDIVPLTKSFSTNVTIPLVFDSTETDVIEAALKCYPGKALLNSANFEDGDDEKSRASRIMKLAKTYGAGVVCLTIDENGQARTVDEKILIGRRLIDFAREHAIADEDLLIDNLTFPLTSGSEDLRNDGQATLSAIEVLRNEFPQISLILGISNISFGINPSSRKILNTMFLSEAINSGLTGAIVNVAGILPLHRLSDEEKDIALRLIHNDNSKGDPLEQLLGLEVSNVSKPEEQVLDTLTLEERLVQRIVDAATSGLITDLDLAREKYSPLEIINTYLLEGMKIVGDRFGDGSMQLPFVLKSAETMKASVAHLEQFMEKSDTTSKGTIVLATVKGDVHDIGKNLVDIILTNNGFKVINLGIKVPITDMLASANEHNADAVGMSGLLVKSTLVMRENLEYLNENDSSEIPIILGGAALTRRYVNEDLRKIYDGTVLYAKDAFEGLDTMRAISEGEDLTSRKSEKGRFTHLLEGRESDSSDSLSEQENNPKNISVELDRYEPIVPPFLGTRVAKGIPLDDISPYINETALYRNQWQYRPDTKLGENNTQFKQRLRKLRADIISNAKRHGWLDPQVLWGYFPCNSDGDELIIWSDPTRNEERIRLSFPRQSKSPFRCISDFFLGVDDSVDYCAFQVASMGSAASIHCEKLFKDDNYVEYLHAHGMSVEMTEALAELWHKRIRQEWGCDGDDDKSVEGLFRQRYQGSRFSWGYPACPDLTQQFIVNEIMDFSQIGVELTQEAHFVPEQTTSAIIVPHRQAKYFVV